MDRKMRFNPGMVLATLISLFIFSGPIHAAEFSADMVFDNIEGKGTAKAYVKGDKQRQEGVKGGEKFITIIRMDKGVFYTLMTEQKMYVEMPGIGRGAVDPEMEEKIKDMAEKKYLGKEKVNGYVCDKYQYIYHDKSSGTMTLWISKKLKYMIKMEHKAPSYHMSFEYKNIKERSISDSLFEIPEGYQKMKMPAMPGRSQ